MSNIIIREAGTGDINAISFMAHEIWPVAYGEMLSPEQLKYMLHNIYSYRSLEEEFDAGHHFIIIEEAHKPIAFAAYNHLKGTVYKLQKIYALPQQQGKGLGKLLINHIIEKIKTQGATVLLLNVNRRNKAKQFYEHLGFTIISEEDIDIGQGYFMNDYVMEKKLV